MEKELTKYWTVFKISWENGFVYRLNFLLWRARSVIVILTVYFLWEAIFRSNDIVFGYSREKILTYVFLTLVVRSLVLGLRSIDAAGEIADGRLANYLLKPISYHLYWFVRDLSDKFLNVLFSIGEIVVLYFVLRPPIFIQTDTLILAIFVFALIMAAVLNFVFAWVTSNCAFWVINYAWGFWFVFLVFQDFLGGVMFPLDIFPQPIYNLLTLLPFPYLLYFPVNVYLGKIVGQELTRGLILMVAWLVIGVVLIKKEWMLGLRTYQAEGR